MTQRIEAQQAEGNDFVTPRRAARQITVQGDNTPILNSFAALVPEDRRRQDMTQCERLERGEDYYFTQ